MGKFEEIRAKGTKITAEDLKGLDINNLWKAAEYYCKWSVEDPEFMRLRKVTRMIKREIEDRYFIEDEILKGG